MFYEYIRILKDKEPLFFLAENVSGLLSSRHEKAFSGILESFKKLNYNVNYTLLNANDYDTPQDRERVIIEPIPTLTRSFRVSERARNKANNNGKRKAEKRTNDRRPFARHSNRPTRSCGILPKLPLQAKTKRVKGCVKG